MPSSTLIGGVHFNISLVQLISTCKDPSNRFISLCLPITKPKNFNKEFVNDYLVATLGYLYKTGGEFSLVHIRLDPENNKIIYHQTIDIDERIRDIDFLIKEKKIVLSLESSNSIGILSFN